MDKQLTHVLVIQPAGKDSADKLVKSFGFSMLAIVARTNTYELRTVGVLSGVGHGKSSSASVLEFASNRGE